MATSTKEREQKFSLDDCIILCNVMAEDCGLNGLSNHELLKHRFTEGNQIQGQNTNFEKRATAFFQGKKTHFSGFGE
ncbi:hypothetical protein DPMN_018998 [Dreissena polymorpha]|uniref:Uncharacterized protein n=1 Tax=Dreissena polymorpha TaxID=45954 RepID=A0A9D4S6W3_DREPO|nr:hypothetical protein DPMN_018998 [Dreissena polymorpha]